MRCFLYGILLAASIGLFTTAASAGSVVLTWTAPGEDSLVGTAARYDLRYSSTRLTAASFDTATVVPDLPAPGTPGSIETVTVDGLGPGATYYFAIRTQDAAGNWSPMSNVVARTIDGRAATIALGCSFSSPYPNPARESAAFPFLLPRAGRVEAEVFDLAGRRVRVLSLDRGAGQGTLDFDLRDEGGARLPSGVYVVRARLAGAVFTRRLVVTR